MSSLVYRGATAGVTLRFLAAHPHITHDVAAWGASGRLQDKSRQSSLRENEFGAAYQCLFPFQQSRGLRFSLGGEISSFLQLREHQDYNNNPAYYVFNSSIGPVVKGTYEFSGRWQLSTSLFCPAASLLSVSRGTANKENDFYSSTWKSILKNTQPAFWNRYAGLGINTILYLPVGETNRLYFAWKWQYYRIGDTGDLQSAANTITVNYYFSL
ncbi:hypothetical protein SAMN04488122_5417 [Chitinophaga arvensicola]|uniref:Outer membrane protein beta-barrel domain-containing protein n=2 Tax=Chitinophaga arvensicola TaxID=29529 RepID=A0A1I0SA98_9BACT|nr:hypothetical protein SAMN04488122_5417 [Chitinophaga arvensicola]